MSTTNPEIARLLDVLDALYLATASAASSPDMQAARQLAFDTIAEYRDPTLAGARAMAARFRTPFNT